MLKIPNHSVYGIYNVQYPQKTTARAKLDKAEKKAPVPAPKPFTLDDILQKTTTYSQGLVKSWASGRERQPFPSLKLGNGVEHT